MSHGDLHLDASWCEPDAATGSTGTLRVHDLSPTQFAVGKAEVTVKAARMRHRYAKHRQHLIDYLTARPAPVVVRKGTFHLTDHHHMVRALHDALHTKVGADLSVFVEVIANLSDHSHVKFWRTMHDRNWVYLFAENGGGPQQPEILPKHIKDLGYDAYRSLAWIVREQGGYVKNDTPFSEFRWANFFRTRILLDQDILAGKHTFDDFAFDVDDHGKLALSDDGRDVVARALALAAGPEARGMPGIQEAG